MVFSYLYENDEKLLNIVLPHNKLDMSTSFLLDKTMFNQSSQETRMPTLLSQNEYATNKTTYASLPMSMVIAMEFSIA